MAVRRALLTTSPRGRAVRIGAAWLGCLLALALCPGLASALTIGSFETSRTGADGSPLAQAGAHPNLIASFAFGESGEPEAAKNVRLGLPEGFFIIRADHGGDPSQLLGTAPVYALPPAAGEIARFGFVAPLVNLRVEVPVTVRSGSDYGLDLTFQNLPEEAALAETKLTLWGTPADPTHDSERFGPGAPGAPANCPGVEGTSCLVGQSPVAVPPTPLLHNPTSCDGPIASHLDLNTYEHPAIFPSATATDILGTSGCNRNAFDPMLLAELTTVQTQAPSGLIVALGVNDEGFYNPDGIDGAQIKSVSVALPAGLEIDSAIAASLDTCTDAQLGAGSALPSSCPLDSKLGTFAIAVAGLGDFLEGDAYFGTPEPDGTYRLFLTASGPNFGTKLVGRLQPSSPSEPVTLALPNLPQLPLAELELELTEPDLLVTPSECGTYEAAATVTPWGLPNASAVLLGSAFSLEAGPDGGPCVSGASPTRTANEVSRPAPILPPPPSAPVPPLVTITKKPPRRAHDRTPSFGFRSTAAGASFSCKVDGQRFGHCTSPRTLSKLSFGSHTFSVRATDAAGTASAPATYRFSVLKPAAS